LKSNNWTEGRLAHSEWVVAMELNRAVVGPGDRGYWEWTGGYQTKTREISVSFLVCFCLVQAVPGSKGYGQSVEWAGTNLPGAISS